MHHRIICEITEEYRPPNQIEAASDPTKNNFTMVFESRGDTGDKRRALPG